METSAKKILLARMDEAFTDCFRASERLSIFLADTQDPSSWSSYHELLKLRTVETVAFEKYRKIQEELFSHIHPPAAPLRNESSVF